MITAIRQFIQWLILSHSFNAVGEASKSLPQHCNNMASKEWSTQRNEDVVTFSANIRDQNLWATADNNLVISFSTMQQKIHTFAKDHTLIPSTLICYKTCN